jgi:rRNA maturation endonuclease Nob1
MQNQFLDKCDTCKEKIDVREAHLCAYQGGVVRICKRCHEEICDDHIRGEVESDLRNEYAEEEV